MAGNIVVNNLSVKFGDLSPVLAVEDVNFEISPGELVSLLGVSGCGKSTVINCAAGFVHPSTGEVRIDGTVVKGTDPKVGVVFQNFVLFPWKRVRQNIEFGPRIQHLPVKEIRERADYYLHLMGLTKFQDHYPAQLSGGMQQRVAIARSLINDPAVLLMDEPFGSLDSHTRVFMQEMLLNLWDEFRKTILFVTHDIDEAIFLSDRILVMTASPGKIKSEIPVELKRPRKHDDVNLRSEFLSIKERLQGLIREETRKVLGTLPAFNKLS